MPILPASPLYRRGVSFNTFDSKDAPSKLFTLTSAHSGYATTSDRRVFLCGLDGTDSADLVLDWVLGVLVDDGDEIVCVSGVEKESMLTSWPSSKRGRHRIEAEKLMESVVSKNTSEKGIKVVVEIVGGKIPVAVQSIVDLYEPSALVVAASHGSTPGTKSMLSDSVSSCCWIPKVPVIVVRAGMASSERKHQNQGQGRRLSDQRSISHSLSISSQDSVLSTQESTRGTAKAGGRTHRGILKNKHERLFIRKDSGKCDAETDETLGEQGFSLPIGFLSTESGPQADLAMQSPSIAALEENWEDDEPSSSHGKRQQHMAKDEGDDDAAASDAEDDVKPMKILDERRPSVRETTPWLASILGPTRMNPRGHNRKSRGDS